MSARPHCHAGLAALVLALALAVAPRALAQCASNASSCVSCHEAQALRPVLQAPQSWHRDHGYGDLCAACHGGAPAATTRDNAHAGVRDPLTDPPRACAPCHADETAARAARYADEHARFLSARASANAVEAAPTSGPPDAAPRDTVRTTPASAARTNGTRAPREHRADRVLLALSMLLTLALTVEARALVRRARMGVDAKPASRRRVYLAGALLGLVVAFSEVRFARPLAASGAFDTLAKWASRALVLTPPRALAAPTPAPTWQLLVVLGVVLGSLAASALAGELRLRWLPDAGYRARFGSRRSVRLALAYLGATLVQFGAGIAGGCTSGLAISGGVALAPGAFVFMAGMFLSGLPTAFLLFHRARPRD